MTITVEIPDGAQASGIATEWPEPLGHPSDYPSESAYIAEAVRRACEFGVDPEVAAGLAAGLADIAAGRALTLDEAQDEFDRAFEERCTQHKHK